jgi:type IV secretion system protein TrbL
MVDLIDAVLEGFKDIVGWVISQFKQGLQTGYEDLSELLFGTPTPQTDGAFIFGEPVNAPWPAIQDALVGGEIMLIALFLLMMSVQGRHTIRILNIGSAYEARKTRKTAWGGAFLIVTWYWIGTLVLYLVDGFTLALMPDLSSLTSAMLGFVAGSVPNPALGLLFAFLGGLAMWALEALLYLRRILLYVYLYGMPIAFALAYGNVPVTSNVAMELSKRFVPLAILPLPAAMVLKGYDLVYTGSSGLTPSTLFLKYLVAVSLPLVALFVTWKTFKYATPLTAKVIGGAAKGAVLVGGVAAGAYVGGASVATTAARWGPKAAAGQAIAQKALGQEDTANAGDASSYRRTENDPSPNETTTGDERGMAFDRGIQ